MSNINKIQDAAESKIRSGGYDNFSFREIASEVGIKSSSVHYHYPTKIDLSVAVTRRYTESFMLALENSEQSYSSSSQLLEIYIGLFEKALKEDKQMCLCGLLAAEFTSLPIELKEETKYFFDLNIKWLNKQFLAFYNEEVAYQKAVFFISILEGAMLTSRVINDSYVFDCIIKQLKELIDIF